MFQESAKVPFHPGWKINKTLTATETMRFGTFQKSRTHIPNPIKSILFPSNSQYIASQIL